MNRYLSLIRAHHDEINEKDEIRSGETGVNSLNSFISSPATEELHQTVLRMDEKEMLPASPTVSSEPGNGLYQPYAKDIGDTPESVLRLKVVNRPPFWIDSGTWYGDSLELFPVGLCTCCGWEDAYLCGGVSTICLLCQDANTRVGSGPYHCDCEKNLLVPARYDPGGFLCCPDCKDRIQTKVQEGKAAYDEPAVATA